MNRTFNHNGRIFYQQEGQPYYRSWNSETGRPDYLHRVIWTELNGPIPPGFDVHHLDEDPENNEPYNLEKLTREDHRVLHWESLSTQEQQDIRDSFISRVSKPAAEGHRSEEGRTWHREKAKREIPNRTHNLDCHYCGCPVTRVGTIQAGKFCTPACKAAHRRASGVDNETRTCAYCSAAFVIDRYKKTRTCSRACANRKRHADREGHEG